MNRPTVDQTYMEIALIVSARSTCVRRKVGCVLVDEHNRILSTGYNGVASGHMHCIDSPCPGAKLSSGTGLDKCEALHAEQNAVLLLSDPYKVAIAYVTAFPCTSCMKLLLGTSCRRIVHLEEYAGAGDGLLWWQDRGRAVAQFHLPGKRVDLLRNGNVV